jgi:YVTN family beta-propeller protein
MFFRPETASRRLTKISARIAVAAALIVPVAAMSTQAYGAPVGSPVSVTQNISMGGSNICELVDDGTYIWVAEYGSNQVERINRSTGAVVGSGIPTDANPCRSVLVGSHLFVANSGSNTVTDISTTTASVTRTIALSGSGISSLLYDGTYIWATSYFSSQVERINPSSGAVVGSPISVAGNPGNELLVGTHLFIPGSGSNSVTDIDTTTATVTRTITFSGSNMANMAYDGTNVWVSEFNNAQVARFNPTTGTVGGYSNVGAQPTNVIFANGSIWVGGTGDDTVTQVALNGNVTRAVHLGGGNISNLVYDGAVIWAPNFSSAYISQINATTGTVDSNTLTVGSQPGTVLITNNVVWVASTGSNIVTQISGPTTTTTVPATTTSVASSGTTTTPVTHTTVAIPQSAIATVPSTVAGATTTTVARGISSLAANPAKSDAPSTSATPSAPTIKSVKPGQAATTVDGVDQDVAVSHSNNRLVVTSGPVEVTLASMDRNGSVLSLDAEGNLRLLASDYVSFEADGLAPLHDVDVWLFSTPTKLGVMSVDANGHGSGKFAIPANLERGNHRLALNGFAAAGSQSTMAIGVIGGVVSHSSTMSRILIAIPISLAVAAGLIIPTTTRRRRRKVTA